MARDDPPSLRIRPGMDVFNAYQDRFIGSVVRVWQRDSGPPSGARGVEKETAVEGTSQVHEEGQVASHARAQGSKMLGEEMGPVPTIAAGNRGPINQSAEHDYATAERPDSEPGAVYFAVRPGRWNLGPLTRPFYVPTSAVHSVSMERVVLDVQGGALPDRWRRRPSL